MKRLTALLAAVAVLGSGAAAIVDGIPVEQRPAVTKNAKERQVGKRTVTRMPETVPPVAVPPSLPPLPVPRPLVWVPGHWTWNSPMNTYVWVPGIYIPPPSPEMAQALALRRTGQWIGIDRDD